MKKLLNALAITFGLVMPASAANVQNSIAAISAFECATWADMSGYDKEAERLFNYGVEVGRQFLQDAQDNKFTAKDYSSVVPMVWGMNRGGPTIDFVLGKIYTRMADEAYDKVVKVGANGLTSFNPNDWVKDEMLRKQLAINKYNSSNCKLIGMGQ